MLLVIPLVAVTSAEAVDQAAQLIEMATGLSTTVPRGSTKTSVSMADSTTDAHWQRIFGHTDFNPGTGSAVSKRIKYIN